MFTDILSCDILLNSYFFTLSVTSGAAQTPDTSRLLFRPTGDTSRRIGNPPNRTPNRTERTPRRTNVRVKDTDTCAKSKSRDRHDRRDEPAENLLAQKEDDEDAVEVSEEQERELPGFSVELRQCRDTISFEVDDPEAEDPVCREYYSKEQFLLL